MISLFMACVLALLTLVCCDEDDAYSTFQVESPAFGQEQTIPARHTCDGADSSPPLVFEDVPPKATYFCLIMDDPDAPGGTVTHWLMWGVPADQSFLAENQPKVEYPAEGVVQGMNAAEQLGYFGPCPPEDEVHRYFFRVYALDRAISLAAGASRSELEDAIDGHIVGYGELVGLYQRQ